MSPNVKNLRWPRIPPVVRRTAVAVFYVTVAAVCFLAVRHALRPAGFAGIVPAFGAVPVGGLLVSALAVAGVFTMIWTMEQAALRDAGRPRGAPILVTTPLVANALSLGAGFGVISGSALRIRLYGRHGLPAATALFVASSVTIMSLLGAALIAAIGCLSGAVAVTGLSASVTAALPWLGGVLGLGLLSLAIAAGPRGRTMTIAKRSFRLPSAGGLAFFVMLGALDWLFSAASLFALLPAAARPNFFNFVATFTTLQLVSIATGAPAGLGVFDTMMLSFGHGAVEPERMAAALICYRVLSFVAPIAIAVAAVAIMERRRPASPVVVEPERPSRIESAKSDPVPPT